MAGPTVRSRGQEVMPDTIRETGLGALGARALSPVTRTMKLSEGKGLPSLAYGWEGEVDG